MTEIMIFAEVDGVIAMAHFAATDLKWIPVNMGTTVRADMLPHRVRKIEIHTDRGMFYQDFEEKISSRFSEKKDAENG